MHKTIVLCLVDVPTIPALHVSTPPGALDVVPGLFGMYDCMIKQFCQRDSQKCQYPI